MKISLLKNKTEKELIIFLNDLFKEKFKYNIDRATGEFSKVHLFSKNKKNIAKILTIINEKKRAQVL
ncbi:MAG TPA: 50S ribosomal protein L29 [Candidatus Azosocius sp. HAIN]